ncbi:MAG: PD40 domain-containing protein [Prevotella sp.]|nr:PD40 domain-containing protein [Prevotella sp.]
MCLPIAVSAQVLSVKSVEKVPIPVDADNAVAAISPGGDYILLTTSTHRGLKKFDLATGETTTLTEAEGAGYGATVTADGKTIVYRETSFTPQHLKMTALKSISTVTGAKRELAPAQRMLQGYRLDGNAAAVISKGKMRVRSLNGAKIVATPPTLSLTQNHQMQLTRNGKTTLLAPNGKNVRYIWPSLSPDGTKVLYYVSGVGCFVCDLNGNNVKPMGQLRAAKWYDNTTIVGMNDQDNGEYVTSSSIIAKTLSGAEQKLTSDEIIAQYPQVSPSSRKIAFETPAGEAYIINLQ